MSVKHIGLLLDHFQAPPALKLISIILADHADSDGICWPSYRKIAERACMSERQVRRHVKELQRLGIVTKIRTGTIVKQGDKISRISNAYRVNANAIVSKLSTEPLLITDTNDRLEVDAGDRTRGSRVTTKSSFNHQPNRHTDPPVDNSESLVSLVDIIRQAMEGTA